MLNKKVIILLSVLMVSIALGVIWISPWSMSLEKIHAGIEKGYRNVKHIDAVMLSKMNYEDILLFDVREFEEYEVSHIKGAIQINPDIESDDFEDEFSDLIEDKVVIFYCSVGVRSTAQASRLEAVLSDANASSFYNLKGGLFQWHNESRPIVKSDDASTKNIHPYNDYWGKLIEKKRSISYF